MSQPWMPLYIADYLADTSHLRALESGAYLHLIMHYWQHGALPDDDRKLATIAKVTDVEWRRSRPTLIGFFKPGWRHARIDKELTISVEKYQKRVAAGRKGGKQKASNATVLLDENGGENLAMLYQPQPQLQRVKVEGENARARDPEPLISEAAISLSNQLLRAIKADPEAPEWYGFPYLVQAWITLGCPRDLIVATVTGAAGGHTRLPHKNYFDKSVRRAFEDAQSTPAGEGRKNARAANGLSGALDKLRADIAADEREAQEGGSNIVRLLPDGRRA